MNKIDEIKELVEELNHYRDLYYNSQISEISDYEYDEKFDKLVELEKETNFILFNSPTQTVGYEVKSELNKVNHNHPMLSLDKTKSVDDVLKFLGNRDGIIMAKMDGLTCSVRYVNGELVSAETRGNGEIGEDILHCAKTIKNLPSHIDCKDEIIIDGEVIITYDDFEKINSKLPEDQRYKHPRNLASGSIRQLDKKIAAERNMKFIAWKMIKGYDDNSFVSRLFRIDNFGFDITPLVVLPEELINKEKIENAITLVKQWAKDESYPIDGCVFGYDDIAYGDSLGATGHHLRSQLAFKFYDDLYETTLRDIEWTMGKTSVLTPTAVFDPVEIDGTEVSRASVHNISILKNLGLTNNCTVRVYKANQIIPQIDSADQDGDSPIIIPKYCPICGGKTKVVKENESEVLVCINDNCSGKLLGKMKAFVAKSAANVEGISESTLQFLIDKGWIKTFADIYHLSDYAEDWKQCEGFGEKSVNALLKSIEKSRDIKLENFLAAIGIPDVGLSTAKIISEHFEGNFGKLLWDSDRFNFGCLEGIGTLTAHKIRDFFRENYAEVNDLAKEFNFTIQKKIEVKDNPFVGKSICVTGKLNSFNRDSINAKITELGAKVASGVTSKTDYLITNTPDSGSSKNVNAKKFGTKIITESEFLQMIGE